MLEKIASKKERVKLILLASFVLTMYSVYMYTIMWHNIDLSYNYQKLQADGLLPSAEYADIGAELVGGVKNRYNVNLIYAYSQRWQQLYIITTILGTIIFVYSLSYP